MRIVADENIPFVHEAFDRLGDVLTLTGRNMAADDVADADVLLVRSVTEVSADLLSESNVRFVGTATIGTDHIDQAYLTERGIGFSSAAGSNANSVAEYVVAQLLRMGGRLGLDWSGRTIGVVGVGNIGRLVVRNAEAMGMRVLQNDPPRARDEGPETFVDLDTVCAEADVITMHTPLIREGVDKTVHLMNDERIRSMRPGSVLMNSGRGPAIDNAALRESLPTGTPRAACLDVWEHEPNIDVHLLGKVALGTPHIAGYSFDGKVAGTEMLFDAVCGHLELDATWDPGECLPEPIVPEVKVQCTAKSDQRVLREVVRQVYDIEADDRRMRGLIETAEDDRPGYFDRLRKEYPVRREFTNTRVHLIDGNEAIEQTLAAWGFEVV